MRRCLILILLTLLTGVGVRLSAQGYTSTNPGMYWVPPSACVSSVSGNSTGTNGLTSSGVFLVDQASTSASGTNTHTYVCNISPLGIKTTGTGYAILDVVFTYGVAPTTAGNLGTQAATLASGTMNSSTVFSFVAYPTPSGSETASSATPVRADAGTLVITPAVASFQVNTLAVGRFYTVKFTPATPIAWKTDLQQLFLTVTLQGAATVATITNTPGILVHLTSR